jgi:hypothetical protein
MTLITNNILISFIEKNLSMIDKIGNIDLNIYHHEEKSVNKTIKINGILDIFFDNSKYYQYSNNLKYLLINDITHNVSLLSSMIYCLYSQYNDKSEVDKETFIKKLIEKLSSDVFVKFTEFEYSKLKWKKNDIVENINKNNIDYKVLKYLSDYFVINIFIIDNKQLYFCGGSDFIQFRKNIFINKHNDLFHPVFTEYKRTFSLSDKIIQNINNNLDKIKLYYSGLHLKQCIEPIIKIKKNVKFDDKIDDIKVDKKAIEYTDTLNGFDDADTECEISIDGILSIDEILSSDVIEDFTEATNATNSINTINMTKTVSKKTIGDDKNYFKKHSVKELRDIALTCDIDIYKSCGKKLKTKQELLDEMFE